MIIYSFEDEIRIIICLLGFSISIVSIYDVLMMLVKKNIKFIIQIIYTIFSIYLTYQYSFKIKNGYIPQYTIIILLLGIIIYYKFIKQNFFKHINKIRPIVIGIRRIFSIIVKPLLIVKTTFSLYKIKKVKNNNQNTLQK